MTTVNIDNLLPKNIFNFGVLGSKLFTIFIKIIKSLKCALAVGTAVTYSFIFSWKFALLFMLGVGIHEMGHIFAMHRCGMKTKGIYFIPFIGGAAVSDGAFKSSKDEVFIALMGPLIGLLTVIPPLIVFWIFKDPLWAAAASWLALVNLFNLFPVNPLDGGRFVKGIAFSVNSKIGIFILGIGFAIAALFAIKTGMSILWLVILVGMLEIKPFEIWCVVVPISIIFGVIISLIRFILYGPESISEYWIVMYKRVVVNRKNDPIISGLPQMKEGYWNLSKLDIIKYVFWYIVLVIIFLVVILMLSDIPGADFGTQFLKS